MSGVLEKERDPNEVNEYFEFRCTTEISAAGLDPKESKHGLEADFCHLTCLLWPFIDFYQEITGCKPLGSFSIKTLRTLYPFAKYV